MYSVAENVWEGLGGTYLGARTGEGVGVGVGLGVGLIIE
jgi:hypothetical protein